MADSTATLELRILGADKAVSEVNKFEKSTTRAMTASEQSVARSLGRIIAQYASMAVAVQKSVKVLSSGLEFNKFVENTTMSFGVMMKSADAAKAQMKDLYNFAVNSPLTFKETASSAKQLMAYGFAAKELVPTMKSLGAVAIATGHSLDDISYIYGTLKSQGRAYSRDLMQFGMRGIPIYDELAKVLGVGTDKIQKMASEGKIGFKEVEKAFQNMTTNGGKFAGILEGYMTTLTGKISMLSDIAQQSAGKATTGIFDAMKTGVEGLTSSLGDKNIQDTIATISVDLGHIAEALVQVVLTVVKLMPLISALLKIVMAVGVAFLVLKIVPALMLAIGTASMNAAIAVEGIALAGASATTAFGAMTTGIGFLSGALKSLLIANPWFTALMLIAAAGGTILTIMHVNADKAKASENEVVRAKQLKSDLRVQAMESGQNYGYGAINTSVAGVKAIAADYRLAEENVAKILIDMGQITQATWNAQKATIALASATANMYDNLDKKKKLNPPTQEQVQADFLSTLTGKDALGYMDNSKGEAGLSALGMTGANDYIQGFVDKMKADADKYGAAFTPDMKKANLEDEIKGLYDALDKGSKIPNLFEKTGFDETIIARILQAKKELLGLGGALEKVKKSWTDQEWAAKATETQVDDIQLTHDKAMYAAEQEYMSEGKIRVGMEEEYARVKLNIGKVTAKELADYEQSLRIANFEKMKTGNPEYWKAMQAKAGQGNRGAAAGSALQGTEVGSLMAGADPITMLIMGAMKFLSSIENVAKVLNPITTLFEAMRPILEPLINNAFRPLVDIIEMVGSALSAVVIPLIVYWKILAIQMYIQMMPLIGVIQILGEVFLWLYDLLLPIGNFIITLINSIIKVINTTLGWAGVNLRYIDALQTSTEMLKDFAASATGAKSSLTDTIGYLEKKLTDLLDSQVTSLQDLYEVGAISGSQYESQLAEINKGRIAEDRRVTDSDKALTDIADILARLYELTDAQAYLEANKGLTDTQVTDYLKGLHLLTDSDQALLRDAVYEALLKYGAAQVAAGTKPVPATPSTTPATPDVPDIESATTAGKIADLQELLHGEVVDLNKFKASHPWYDWGAFGGPHKNEWDKVMDFESYISRYRSQILSLGGFPKYAVGTANVPYDMTADIHKGEGIIPATFMDGIRSGKLNLSGGNSGGNNVTVVVNVAGSVTAEKDLAKTVANQMYIQRSRGLLTV